MNRDSQREKDADPRRIARPPFLSFPHKGGRDPNRVRSVFCNDASGGK